MKPDVLVTGQLMPHVMEGLDANYTLHKLYEATDRAGVSGGGRPAHPRHRDAVTPIGVDAALIDACPNLEIVSFDRRRHRFASTSRMRRRRGVIVTNTPDVLNDDVANLAVALLLATTRKLVAYDRYVREGRWVKEGAAAAHAQHRRQADRHRRPRADRPRHRREARGLPLRSSPTSPATSAADVPYAYYADLVELARDSAGADRHRAGRQGDGKADRPRASWTRSGRRAS